MRAAALALLFCGAASAQTIGAHLGTLHASKDARDDNPGLYAVLPFGVAGGRVMLGGYQNSLNTKPRRTSLYIGQTWKFGNFGVAAIVVSGYHKERFEVPCADKQRVTPLHSSFATCYREEGFWHQKWMPVVVPSYALPPVLGLTPRLSLVGVKKAAIHLSMEKSW